MYECNLRYYDVHPPLLFKRDTFNVMKLLALYIEIVLYIDVFRFHIFFEISRLKCWTTYVVHFIAFRNSAVLWKPTMENSKVCWLDFDLAGARCLGVAAGRVASSCHHDHGQARPPSVKIHFQDRSEYDNSINIGKIRCPWCLGAAAGRVARSLPNSLPPWPWPGLTPKREITLSGQKWLWQRQK